MTLSDEVERKNIEEVEFNEDLFYKLMSGKDLTESIKTTRGEFTVIFPKQKDYETIGILQATRRIGVPVQSIDIITDNLMYKCAVLDVLVKDYPNWWVGAKKTNSSLSWRDVPDLNFIDEVYSKLITFRENVQKKLNGTTESSNRKNPTENEQSDVSENVGDGLFSEIGSCNKQT